MDSKRLMDRVRDPAFQRDLVVWTTLVAFGVVARWLQPMWHATPTAAVGLFAGFYFARVRWAMTAPIAVMAISHGLLPSYASWAVMAVVLVAFVLPVFLGRMLGRELTPARCGIAAVLPSLFFYATTNFAVWASALNGYTLDAAGLVSCYASALPFYRWMLYGDLFYIAVIFGCYAVAVQRQWVQRPVRAVARVPR